MKKRYNTTQLGQTPGGVGNTTPPGGQRLVIGAGVGLGGQMGTTNLSTVFGTGLRDPVTWGWIWFGVALAIVFGLPLAIKAGPAHLEV